MNFRKAKNWRIILAVSLILFSLPLYFFSEANVDTYYILIPLICFIQYYLTQRLKNTPMFLIFTLYVFLYFVYLIPHFYFDMNLSQHTQFQERRYFTKVLFEFYLFYSGLVLSTINNFNPKKIILKDAIKINCSKWKQIFYLLFIFIVFLKVINQGENVLSSSNPYAAYKDNLMSNNALPMFLFLFMFFFYYIIDNIKIRKIAYIILFSGLTYYSVTRGYRVLLAPLGFLFFFLYGEGRISFKWIIILFIGAFIGMIGINALKMGTAFEWKYMFSESDDFILSHHADNLYVSATGIGLVEEGTITFTDRILLNLGFFLEAIIPPSFLPTTMKYPLIITYYAQNGGGGLCLGGAYLMWGYAGIIIFSYLIGEIIRYSYITKNKTWKLLSIIILLYSANWFSYDFHVVLRFTVFAFIFYKLLVSIKFNDTKKNISCK